MVVFWGMSATKTDRRHFFLIEKFDGNPSDISSSLVSAGFQNDSQNKEYFTYGSGQVFFKRLHDHLDGDYFGGFIEPGEKLKQRALQLLKLLLLIGKASFFLMAAYVLQWIVAFLAYFVNSQWLFDILGYTIPFAFIFSLLAGGLFVLLGLFFETKSTLLNQDIMNHTIDPFISSLRSAIDGLAIELIFIETRVNDRGLIKRLPSEFCEKIKALGIEHIDAHYWE